MDHGRGAGSGPAFGGGVFGVRVRQGNPADPLGTVIPGGSGAITLQILSSYPGIL